MSNPAAVALGSIKSAKKAAASKRNGLRVPQKYDAKMDSDIVADYWRMGTIKAVAASRGLSRKTVSRMVRGVYLRMEAGQ